jgi:anti-sigma factor RsiW
MTTHLSWETINDYADGVLASGAERDTVARHLDACDECRARVEELRAFLRDANGATAEVAPPDDVWPAVRSEIERRKVIDLPGLRGVGWTRTRAGARWMMAAAAVTLIVASSSITAVIMRERASSPPVSGDATTVETRMLEVARVEQGYLDTVVELTAALDAARPQLSPATIAVVERNLAVIDAAIAESKAALFKDPGNRVLLEVLSGTYRQKLDLLRRAAQLASS